MRRSRLGSATAITLLAGALMIKPAMATGCQTGSFETWLADFRRLAAAEGISPRAIAAGLEGLTFDKGIVARDRGQGVFAQSFLEFSGRMVSPFRLQRGASLINKHRDTFAAIEQRFGVPAPVIVAFWGLETDFGAVMGSEPTLRSLATLAYDCRRSEKFQAELMDALRLIDRGDLTPREMVGPWAGELGQMQFLASVYVSHAVDFDGDGRRDLIRSMPDALASGANYLASLGWQRGQPWLQEVRLPAELPWDQADLEIWHPRTNWAQWGVRQGDGKPLPADGLAASLMLPMGRGGPAFLAYLNFQVYLKWNKSLVYSTTAAYLATRLAGAPPLSRGNGNVTPLSLAQVKELQLLLQRHGYDVGKVDGVLGASTRSAVKEMQVKFGLPADSYPTPELLQRMRAAS